MGLDKVGKSVVIDGGRRLGGGASGELGGGAKVGIGVLVDGATGKLVPPSEGATTG